jgi:hypothetical protein
MLISWIGTWWKCSKRRFTTWMTRFLHHDATITICGVWSAGGLLQDACHQIKQGQSGERKNTALTSASPLIPQEIGEQDNAASIPSRCGRMRGYNYIEIRRMRKRV